MSDTARGAPPVEWLRFTTRFAPVVSISALCLLAAFMGGVGISDSDNALGPRYSELLQAARAPDAYQVAMFFDALGWLTIGVLLVGFSRVLAPRAPVASTFILIAGAGHLIGVLGGVLRLTGVHAIALEYSATTDPAALGGLRTSFTDLYAVISGLFLVGDVLAAAGWILVGASVWRTGTLAKWVAGWAVVSGGVVAVFTPLSAAGADFAFPILLTYILGGVIVFPAVFAIRHWRLPAARPEPRTTP